MGKYDDAMYSYLSDNGRFADLFNGAVIIIRLPFDEEDYFFFIQRPADGTLFLEMSKEGDRDSEENLFRAIIISKKAAD